MTGSYYILHAIKVLGTIGLPPDNWKITNKKKKMFWFPTSKRLAVTFILHHLANVKLSYVSRVHRKVHNGNFCFAYGQRHINITRNVIGPKSRQEDCRKN